MGNPFKVICVSMDNSKIKGRKYMKKKKANKIQRTINFDADIIERIATVKGRLSRSKYVCIALDEIITRDEKRLGIS